MIGKSVHAVCLVLAFAIATEVSAATSLNINLSARDLPPMDIPVTIPDPYVIVYYSANPFQQYTKIGETRYYDDKWEVEWPETFNFEYDGVENQQRLKFDVYDYDWDEDDQIGIVEIYMSEIINTFGYVVDKAIEGPKNQGWLTIKGSIVTKEAGDESLPLLKMPVPMPVVHHSKRAEAPSV